VYLGYFAAGERRKKNPGRPGEILSFHREGDGGERLAEDQ